MTPRGHTLLVEELKRLERSERPRMVEAIRVAREHGDLSENAEYEAAKHEQGLIEGRIRSLQDKLARAEVVDGSDVPPGRVRFGTTVVLEETNSGEEVTYTLVGEDEADIRKGLLSVTSPVARALLGRAVDETATVTVPAGTREYEVRDISYSGQE
jgi:transcription elongation factor GreA